MLGCSQPIYGVLSAFLERKTDPRVSGAGAVGVPAENLGADVGAGLMASWLSFGASRM